MRPKATQVTPTNGTGQAANAVRAGRDIRAAPGTSIRPAQTGRMLSACVRRQPRQPLSTIARTGQAEWLDDVLGTEIDSDGIYSLARRHAVRAWRKAPDGEAPPPGRSAKPSISRAPRLVRGGHDGRGKRSRVPRHPHDGRGNRQTARDAWRCSEDRRQANRPSAPAPNSHRKSGSGTVAVTPANWSALSV